HPGAAGREGGASVPGRSAAEGQTTGAAARRRDPRRTAEVPGVPAQQLSALRLPGTEQLPDVALSRRTVPGLVTLLLRRLLLGRRRARRSAAVAGVQLAAAGLARPRHRLGPE